MGRARAKRARARRAPLLESRRLQAIAEEAVQGGRFEDAMHYLTEVSGETWMVQSKPRRPSVFSLHRKRTRSRKGSYAFGVRQDDTTVVKGPQYTAVAGRGILPYWLMMCQEIKRTLGVTNVDFM